MSNQQPKLSPAMDVTARRQAKALLAARATGTVPVVANYCLQQARAVKAPDWKDWTRLRDDYDYDGGESVLEFYGVTEGIKRDGSNVRVSGIEIDGFRGNPVFVAFHRYDDTPVGRIVGTRIGKAPSGAAAFLIRVARLATPEVREDGRPRKQIERANEIMDMYEHGDMHAVSFGWRALEFEELRDDDGRVTGFDFVRSDALEWSAVTVPADAEAVMARIRTGKLAAEDVVVGRPRAVYLMREEVEEQEQIDETPADGTPTDAPPAEAPEPVAADGLSAPVEVLPAEPPPGPGDIDIEGRPYSVEKSDDCPADKPWAVKKKDDDTKMGCHETKEKAQAQMAALYASEERMESLAWLRGARSFDIEAEPSKPASEFLRIVSRYLGCEVRHISMGGTYVPMPRTGSFLSAVDEMLTNWSVNDVRNMRPDGNERPPVYDMLRLNSTRTGIFLVEGSRFLRSKHESSRCVFQVERTWAGIDISTYARREHEHCMTEFIDACWTLARELNFLKGEAFAISGQFLKRGTDSWNDVHLTERNSETLRRVIAMIDSRGGAFPSRGVMLLGPPGTGKTMIGRAMMTEAPKTTFIWISARDFYRMGAFGGLDYGFELARECAPTILFIEDVDSWISPAVVDLLKTQMDGVQQATGVLTVLTTNYPERMPNALIDRPGRFHDILRIDLPTPSIRKTMIAAWLDDITERDLDYLVEQTQGYSGAHVRELCNFVRVLLAEDEKDMGVAIRDALTKLKEQRELITELQLADSNYRPSLRLQRSIQRIRARACSGAKRATAKDDCCGLMDTDLANAVSVVLLDASGGVLRTLPLKRVAKVLAERNRKKLEEAHEHMTMATEHVGAVLADHMGHEKPSEEPMPEPEREAMEAIARRVANMAGDKRRQSSERDLLASVARRIAVLAGRDENGGEQPVEQQAGDDADDIDELDGYYDDLRERAAALRSGATLCGGVK